MIPFVVIILLAGGLFCFCRVMAGPSAPDRVIAADAMITLLAAVLVLLGVFYQRAIFLDVALVYAFLFFVGTLAIAKYLESSGL